MIDLHSHILPGLDDGSPDLATSLAMARMAVADGTTHLACTPHINPGVYETTFAAIRSAIDALTAALQEERIELDLIAGADVHIDPKLPEKLRQGSVPTLNASRYLLFEPPHHVAPPRIEDAVGALAAAGYVPILTHPERLHWIEGHYQIVLKMIERGAAVQLTAGSITGDFGRRARYWSERMLDESLVDIIASDAHNTHSRPPLLSRARDAIAVRLGEAEAQMMVLGHPAAILNNEPLSAKPRQVVPQTPAKRRSTLSQWARKLGIGGG